MGTGTTITSLTSLPSPRHGSLPYGAIDASVTLDVSAMPDLTSAEVSNQLQAENVSGHSGSRGSVTSPLVPSGSSPGRNPEGVSGSIAVAKIHSVQTMSTGSLQGGSPQSPQGASSQSLPAVVVGNRSHSDSMPNAPSASKAPQLSSDIYHGRDFSGSNRFTSARSSLPSDRTISGNASAPSSALNESSSDSDDPVSDASQEEADSSDLDATTNEPDPTDGDRQEVRGFFEGVKDPFGELFPDRVGGLGKSLELERTCGDACLLNKSSPKSDSGTSIQPSSRSGEEQSGGVPRSGLEHTLGGLSDDMSRSGSQGRRSLKNMKELDPGSSDSVVRMKSSD
jgi:hypothetical protein